MYWYFTVNFHTAAQISSVSIGVLYTFRRLFIGVLIYKGHEGDATRRCIQRTRAYYLYVCLLSITKSDDLVLQKHQSRVQGPEPYHAYMMPSLSK